MAPTDRRSEKRKQTAELIEQAITAKLAEKLRARPERLGKLIELGVIDEQALARLPEDLDFETALAEFRDRIAEMARSKPSVLARLGMRSIEILTPDKDETGTPPELPTSRLTVVFSDLEGFTGFTSTRGDRDAGALLTDHYDTVESVVRGRGGRVVKTIGDGHMLSFGEPAAAVAAMPELVAAAPGPLRVRTGANHGSVMATGDDLLGHVVNVAARVTDLADGGMSLATTSLRAAAGRVPHVSFSEVRTAEVPGLTEAIEICEVVHA